MCHDLSEFLLNRLPLNPPLGIIYAEAYLDIILTTEEFHFEFDSELFLKKTSGTSVTPCIICRAPISRSRDADALGLSLSSNFMLRRRENERGKKEREKEA